MLHQFQEEGMKGKSPETVSSYISDLKRFEKWLDGAGTNLKEYARSDVQQYIDYLAAQKKSASTLNKAFAAIRKFSKWAGKREAIEDIRVTTPPDYKKTAPKSLSRKEKLKLLREVDRSGNKRDNAIINFLLYTGARVSELVSLDRNNIKVGERSGSVTIVGKGNKERWVPLNAEVRRALKMYLEERTDEEPALFISTRGKRITKRTVQHILKKYGTHPHILRHTFITQLVREEGADLALVQQLSGHSSADMVLRYSKPTHEEIEKVVEKVR